MASIITRKRFTADEYQRMGQVGILTEGERVELIDGEIVAMTPIADSSIGYDQEMKTLLYAGVSIPEYWLVDVNATVVWRYFSPVQGTYRNIEQYHCGQSIAPSLLPACRISVDEVLTE